MSKMRWALVIVFLAGYCAGTISCQELQENYKDGKGGLIDCVAICSFNNNGPSLTKSSQVCQCTPNHNGSYGIKTCPSKSSRQRLVKRDAVQELVKKLNQRKPPAKKVIAIKPRKFSYQKRPGIKHNLHPKKAELPIGRNALHKDLETRLKELRARVAGHPRLNERVNIEPEEKINVLKKFKIRQEELLDKFKKAASARQSLDVTNNALNSLQNRINLPSAKLGAGIKSSDIESSDFSTPESRNTTELAKNPIIVLKSSTTTPPTPVNNINNADVSNTDQAVNSKKSDNLPMAIERFKEKQKETVLKIKDKISQNKSKTTK